MSKCVIKNCEGKAIARQLCWKHLRRWYRHKDTNLKLKRGRKKVMICHCGQPRNLRLKSAMCNECHKKQLILYSNDYRKKHPARIKRYQQKCRWKRILMKETANLSV